MEERASYREIPSDRRKLSAERPSGLPRAGKPLWFCPDIGPQMGESSEGSSTGEPIDLLVRSTRDLLRPEELVREATRDIVKDEIRRHLEKTLKEDPTLQQALREAVRDLLAARANEYAAVLRVGTATARLGLSALPPEVRRTLMKDLVDLLSKELGQIVERSL